MMSPQSERECELTALKLLTAKDHSEYELRRSLEHKGFAREVVTVVIDQFIQRGYLNDAALCRMLYAKFLEAGKYGAHAITGKLKQRGFPESVIATAVRESEGDGDETARAAEAVRRKFAKAGNVNAGKAARFLAYRGFSSGTIRKVLTQLYDGEQES